MAYQNTLPKSNKFETLPDDLKSIAEELIRKKFNIEHEPEVVEKPRPSTADEYDDGGQSSVRYVEIYSSHHPYRQVMPVYLGAGGNSEYIERYIMRKVRELTQKYHVPFSARTCSENRYQEEKDPRRGFSYYGVPF